MKKKAYIFSFFPIEKEYIFLKTSTMFLKTVYFQKVNFFDFSYQKGSKL
jgi:hypothetical protein